LAGSASELKLVIIFIFLGIQHVAALGAEPKGDLLELLGFAVGRGQGRGRASHGYVVVMFVETRGGKDDRSR
jgi:hypothetical protein